MRRARKWKILQLEKRKTVGITILSDSVGEASKSTHVRKGF